MVVVGKLKPLSPISSLLLHAQDVFETMPQPMPTYNKERTRAGQQRARMRRKGKARSEKEREQEEASLRWQGREE